MNEDEESEGKTQGALVSRLLTPNPQLCPREVKPKPERRELSQLLNLSTHPQHYPLKINHAGKPLSKTLASYVSTHAPHSTGTSLETSPPLFQEADVRMAAIKHDVSLGNVEAITLTVEIWKRAGSSRISAAASLHKAPLCNLPKAHKYNCNQERREEGEREDGQ
ncbi:hypothetical protein Q5P01_017327 [Channa striata]|uniref:Uncharacterized protein n=1 Tax=Channa striata TaxID=64152 RepID=A0AA88SIY1_CHASR|nr:hypothetical protein Q5P01_017327 [Channa striata]